MNRRSTLTALAVLLAMVATTQAAVPSLELGPAPLADFSDPYTGRVSAVACSRTDPNLYYVSGADGGVWKTTDGGVSWTPLTDHLPTTAIGALAIDPTNENIIYAGTGEANYANHSRYGLGLYKSADGGQTWQHLAQSTFAGRTFSRIAIDPLNPQVLYAAIGRAGGFPEMAAAKGHPDALGPIGIFKSSDGGVTWAQLLGGLSNQVGTDVAIHPTDPNIVYAAHGNIFGKNANGIYRSLDAGNTWTKYSTGLVDGRLSGRITIAIAPSQPQRLYALIGQPCDASGGSGETRGAYRSDDGGVTWTWLETLPNIQATYSWFLSIVGVNPQDPNHVVVGGLSLYESKNAGATWTAITPPHVDLHGIDWDAAGRMVVGDDGGVHRRVGSIWSSLNDGLGLVQFYAGLSTHPADAEVLLGGTQDNGSNIRTGGLNWSQVFGGDGGWTQLDQAQPLRLFVEFQGSGNLFRSENGGTTVVGSGAGISTSDRNCFLPPYLIDPADSSRMLYATHRVYRSLNGGVSWQVLSADLTGGGSAAIRALALAPSDSNVVYVATNDGRVQRSGDGGATFTLLLTNHLGWPRVTREICVHPVDPNTVYLATAAFGVDQVQRSTDGGATWIALDGDLPDMPVNTLAVDPRGPDPVLYAGTEDGLYRSVDDGANWRRYGALPHTPVIDLRVETGRQRITAATQGRGAWRLPIGIPGDCNCDGVVNFKDIDYLVAALGSETNWAAFYAAHNNGNLPPCPYVSCDPTGDGAVTFADIDPFVGLLAAAGE